MDGKIDFRAHTIAFHLAVARMSGNPLLGLIIHSFVRLCEILTLEGPHYPELVKDVYELHEAFVDAVEARDAGRCEQLMLEETEKMENVFARMATPIR